MAPGPGLCLLFVDDVRVVQFQDMGIMIHSTPQELLTRQMESHLRLYQASPATEGRLTVTGPAGVLCRAGPWLTAPVLFSSLLATVCFLRAFYYLAPLVSDLVAFLSSRINSFSCTPLLPLR